MAPATRPAVQVRRVSAPATESSSGELDVFRISAVAVAVRELDPYSVGRFHSFGYYAGSTTVSFAVTVNGDVNELNFHTLGKLVADISFFQRESPLNLKARPVCG